MSGVRLSYRNPRLLRTIFLQLQKQQNSGLYCDLILQGDGEGVPVHSCLLSACSPYLATVLSAPCNTSEFSIYSITKNGCSRRVLCVPGLSSCFLLPIVRYIYTSELEVSPAEACGVLEAARRLRIPELNVLRQEGGRLVKPEPGRRLNRDCLWSSISGKAPDTNIHCNRVKGASETLPCQATLVCAANTVSGTGPPTTAGAVGSNPTKANNHRRLAKETETKTSHDGLEKEGPEEKHMRDGKAPASATKILRVEKAKETLFHHTPIEVEKVYEIAKHQGNCLGLSTCKGIQKEELRNIGNSQNLESKSLILRAPAFKRESFPETASFDNTISEKGQSGIQWTEQYDKKKDNQLECKSECSWDLKYKQDPIQRETLKQELSVNQIITGPVESAKQGQDCISALDKRAPEARTEVLEKTQEKGCAKPFKDRADFQSSQETEISQGEKRHFGKMGPEENGVESVKLKKTQDGFCWEVVKAAEPGRVLDSSDQSKKLSELEELIDFMLGVPSPHSPELDVGAVSPPSTCREAVWPDASSESDIDIEVIE